MRSERRTRIPDSKTNAEEWFHFSALSHPETITWLVTGAILLLALALRVYGLGDKGFWGDEIFQVRQSLRPLGALLTRGQTPEIYDDFALHFIVLHFVGELGQTEFWLRLPSVAYSLLALPATFLIGCRTFGRTAGVIAMLLLAVAPFQIWYAQETRMYAAHTFYSALSFYFFLSLLKRVNRASVIGLTIVNTLGWYNHLFMLFPLLVEGLMGILLLLFSLQRRRGDRRGLAILASLGLTTLLGAPLAFGFLPFLPQQVSAASTEAGGANAKIDFKFIQDLFMYLGLGADWGWRVAVTAGLAGVGAIWLVRRDVKMLWIPLAFVLPLVALYLVPPAGNVAHRYLIFLQPLLLVLAAGGVWLFARFIIQRLIQAKMPRLGASIAVASAALLLLCLLVLPPLMALYPRAKLNDWRALTNHIRRELGTNDRVFVETAPWAERAFRWYYPEARARFVTLQALASARAAGQRIWYISFGGFFDNASDAWAKENLVRVEDGTWQQAGLVYAPRDEFIFPQSESGTTLYVSEW